MNYIYDLIILVFPSFFLYLIYSSPLRLSFKVLIIGSICIESIYSFVYLFPYYGEERIFSLPTFIISVIFLTLLRYNNEIYREQDIDTASVFDTLFPRSKITNYFAYFGSFIFSTTIFIEYFLADSDLSFSSLLMIFTSSLWFTYTLIPIKYSFEKDVIFFFFNIFSFLTVVPATMYHIFQGDIGGQPSENSFFISSFHFFLIDPLVVILNVLGFFAYSEGNTLYYHDLQKGLTGSVLVGSECSGIHSVIIFISAYISFVMVYYKEQIVHSRQNLYDFILLLLFGCIISYICNLLRMTIIVIVGHYWGFDLLLWTHHYLGWLLFTFWVSLFWYFLPLNKLVLSQDEGKNSF